MILKRCLLMTSILLFTIQALKAQPIDTVRRKDADGWEFFQVKRGKTVLSEGYNHQGIPEGTWITYWESGFPLNITSFRKGMRDGVHVQISQQGYTEMVENYKNNRLEGPRRVYQSGTNFLSEEAFYSEGKKHGSYNKRYAGGKPQEEASYNMDVRDGKTTWFYETGGKAAEYNYRNGSIEGEVASYHKNGRVSEFGVYKNNVQSGPWKEFYENGNIKGEGKYENGQKEGPWKEYDETGKLIKTTKYKNGEPK